MNNYQNEQIESMKKLIGKMVRLKIHPGVEWVGYNENSAAYIVGVDNDAFFEVSYSPKDMYGWKADINEVDFL